jgi:hypothetical protein
MIGAIDEAIEKVKAANSTAPDVKEQSPTKPQPAAKPDSKNGKGANVH